ncbi:MAG: cadmium-translocating P-type ATPase [Caldilineaceae bacterium]|nr:cadmium-translocating P-type ATPase [Caldilineaceae bacterium]
MQTLRLNLPLLLPEVTERDACVQLLIERLAGVRGIDEAHLVRDNGTAQLCLHYDPNLLPMDRLQRLAESTGAAVTDRYRHEQMPFAGLDAADAAATLEKALADLPGMLHTSVSYAAGLIFVAYDSQELARTTIQETIRSLGVRMVGPVRGQVTETVIAAAPDETEVAVRSGARTATETGEVEASDHEDGHDHGNAPGFLPHWMKERWTLLLVALAGLFLAVGFFGERFFGLPTEAAMVFYLLAYVAGGYDVATHAVPGLLRGQFDTDVLMLAAATGAAILGEWVEGAFLLFLFALGHAGEHYALDRARNAVNALGALMPQTARVRRRDRIEEVSVESLAVDDVVIVRPGDRLPVDGAIVEGQSAIDQSPVTGESVPVEKQPGDEVFAGTINQDAALDIRVTKLAKDNTLSRVMKMVQEAQSQQSPTQQFTQRFTRWFVPAVLVFTALVAIVPPLLGWIAWGESFYRAMLLLVASSPCALAIGTPAAVLAGIGQAARNGVLIKGGVHLENLGRLNVMAFDKTGTLTQGRFAVTDVVPLNGASEEDVLRVAGAVEQQSNHPLALAVVRAAQERGLDLPAADGLENVAGRGVRSRVDGDPVLIGTHKLFRETEGHPAAGDTLQAIIKGLELEGKTTMTISRSGTFLGVIALADQPRAAVRQTLQRLLDLGVQKLVLLTGDNAEVAQQIGKEVGVTDVRAGLLPEDKLTAIQELEAEHGAIAMTGDGVNDAPALATATVGIAMGGAGTAVALETADVALMADDLGKLPFAVGLSRASRRIIQQNLFISLGIIGLLIISSVIGIVGLSWAVVLHEGSTIVVVLNALRLLVYRDR